MKTRIDEMEHATARYTSPLHVYSDIQAERKRQDARWGHRDWTPESYTAVAVLTEEVGEVARACLDKEGIHRLREELVQVAAVAVCWIEALDRARHE